MEFQRVVNRLLLVLLLLAMGLVSLMWSPRSLGDYEGYLDPVMSPKEYESYLNKMMETLSSGNAVKLSETGLNRYINGIMQAQQSYALNPWITVNGVYLNLNPDEFSLCLEREIYGRINQIELTQKVFSGESSRGRVTTTLTPEGGLLGKLKLPKNIIFRLSPWLDTFSESVRENLNEVLPYIGTFELRENELIINPARRS